MTEEKRQDDKGGKDRMTRGGLRMAEEKYVIMRESFSYVILRERSDRRIWLRVNSATEESLFTVPRSFADAQDDRRKEAG